GETVGYGALQTMSRDSRLAVVGIGYADGFFRALSSSNSHRGTNIAIRGQLCPLVGRVSMDMIGVDITDLPTPPAPGEMAEIIGRQVSVDDHADAANTIGYEVLTSLKGRYTRHYVDTPEPSQAR
ncbi:alanine racemase C-terminal domain-containing protein, partial [Devosia sp.]|uniref:alanine racemase n=1 Tax=Devosia sp. TaxID=1871048 RepID=UPI001AC338DD